MNSSIRDGRLMTSQSNRTFIALRSSSEVNVALGFFTWFFFSFSHSLIRHLSSCVYPCFDRSDTVFSCGHG